MPEEFKFKKGDKVYIVYSWQFPPNITRTIESVSGKRGDIKVEGISDKFRQDGSQICEGIRGDKIVLWTHELEQEYKLEFERLKLAGEVERKIDEFSKNNRRYLRNESLEKLQSINEILSKYPFVPKTN